MFKYKENKTMGQFLHFCIPIIPIMILCMFFISGITLDLRLSLEEDEQFFEENHEIEELETQINLWNRIEDAFKHLLNSCVILVCLLVLSSFVALAYSYVCRLWR